MGEDITSGRTDLVVGTGRDCSGPLSSKIGEVLCV